MTSDRELARHSLRMLFARNHVASYMHVFVAALVAFVMTSSETVPLWRGLLFVAGLAAILTFQIRLASRNVQRDWSDAEFLRVRRQFDASAIGVGALWGFCSFFLFPSGDPERQLFLTFVIGGMCLSAVGTQGMSLRTCYSSIIPGLSPLALRYVLEGGLNNWLSGFLLFCFLVVIVALARKINDFMLQAFRLQMEKDDLLEDLHEQAEALQSARSDADEANLAKSRFLAQASHDLRQPLHAISLFVESLPNAKSETERQDIMSRVRQSLDVLTKLFDSLLDVTLLDTGGIEVKRQVFRPSDLIAELERDFELVAQACQVELRTVRSSAAVESDPVLVRRMLQNLISNAIRHAEGGRVLIGCRRRGESLSIQVADNGPGIAAEDQKRIFTEFTRLDASRMGAGASPGLGLGLSIVKRVADELDLSVHLQSKVGRGSLFSIDGFSLASPDHLEPIVRFQEATSGFGGAHVFVLDDDPETLEATKLLLTRWGCRVSASQDWTDLLKAAPDVIVCDFEISPEMTGLDVLDRWADEKGPQPPVIMISGHSSQELEVAAHDRGFPLLHKPIRPVQLRSALLNALSSSRESTACGERRGRRARTHI